MSRDSILTRLESMIDSMKRRYLERDEVIMCSIIAMIASEHMLLIGPPGAGKSAVLEDISQNIRDVSVFSYMMNPQTAVEEILGPYHRADKEVGILRRITSNKLPEAQFAFLDEILRATGETLNSLLEVLNDRTILQGGKKQGVPLVSVFGATNDYPETSEMHALYDRFIIRIKTEYIQDIGNLHKMLVNTKASEQDEFGSLSIEEIKSLKKESMLIEVPEEIIRIIVDIRKNLFEKQIYPSDRRIKKSLSLLKVVALLARRKFVVLEDIWILKHILWLEQAHQEEVEKIIDETLLTQREVTR